MLLSQLKNFYDTPSPVPFTHCIVNKNLWILSWKSWLPVKKCLKEKKILFYILSVNWWRRFTCLHLYVVFWRMRWNSTEFKAAICWFWQRQAQRGDQRWHSPPPENEIGHRKNQSKWIIIFIHLSLKHHNYE